MSRASQRRRAAIQQTTTALADAHHDRTMTERKAWLRYVDAAIRDRDAQFAEEQEQEDAEAWCERTTKALDAAKQALVDLGVDFEMLGSEEP